MTAKVEAGELEKTGMVGHNPVGNVNSCRRMSTADILCMSIPVDISFGLAAMPGSETRLSNAALSVLNLKLDRER